MLMGSQVPMFKLRPYRSMIFAAVFCAVVGGLFSIYLFSEEAYDDGSNYGLLTLILTVVLVLIFLLIAFSRYRFDHLRHHRPGYKRG